MLKSPALREIQEGMVFIAEHQNPDPVDPGPDSATWAEGIQEALRRIDAGEVKLPPLQGDS